jgi:hypothetical protein
MLEAAQMAANAGDMLVAEETADAYYRLSKILKDFEQRRSRFGRRTVKTERPSGAIMSAEPNPSVPSPIPERIDAGPLSRK